MQIPSWLANITGANGYNPSREAAFFGGAQPTMMDAMKGIGHDMAQHYRGEPGLGQHPQAQAQAQATPAASGGGGSPFAPAPEAAPTGPMPTPVVQPIAKPQLAVPAPMFNQPAPLAGSAKLDMASLLAALGR